MAEKKPLMLGWMKITFFLSFLLLTFFFVYIMLYCTLYKLYRVEVYAIVVRILVILAASVNCKLYITVIVLFVSHSSIT